MDCRLLFWGWQFDDDSLDLASLDVVRTVFPGKELLSETLRILNTEGNKPIKQGHLIVALEKSFIADEMQSRLNQVAHA